MGTNVFLSYISPDQRLGQDLADKLTQQGLTVAGLTDTLSGEEWGDAMISALNGSDAAVFVISGHATDSAPLMQEYGAARALRKTTVVVLPDDQPLPISFSDQVQVFHAAALSSDQIATQIREKLAA